MTDMTVEIKGAVQAAVADLKSEQKKGIETIQEMARDLAQKHEDAKAELKTFGAKFGDTDAKIVEFAKMITDQADQLQKQHQAIEKLNAELKNPTRPEHQTDKEQEVQLKHLSKFLAARHYGETLNEKDDTPPPAGSLEELAVYEAAKQMFWNAMRLPANVRNVQDVFRHEEMKKLEPLMMRKSISTFSHGNRFWLQNEMSDRIIHCYDDVTDLSMLFDSVSISRGAIEMMVDNDVDKRALFKCEMNTNPPRNPTPALPGTLVIPTFEMHDSECITHTMLEDSEIDIESWLVPRVALGFSRGRNHMFMWGNGVEQPHGLMRPGAHLEMALSPIGGSAAGAITWQHLRILPFQLAKRFHARGSYMMARDAIMSLFTLADGQGRPLVDNFLQVGTDGIMRLWGYPVFQIDQLQDYLNATVAPAVPMTGAKPIGFGSWSDAYMIVNRLGFFVVRDPAYNPAGVTLHFGQRVGGGVLCPNASVFLKV